MLTSCPRCSGKLQLDATMVRCDACGSLWLSRKDMEAEAARRTAEKEKAESYLGTGQLHKDLTELVLISKIALLEKFFEEVNKEKLNSQDWVDKYPDDDEYELVKGHVLAYNNVLNWLFVILEDHAEAYQALMKGKEGGEKGE